MIHFERFNKALILIGLAAKLPLRKISSEDQLNTKNY